MFRRYGLSRVLLSLCGAGVLILGILAPHPGRDTRGGLVAHAALEVPGAPTDLTCRTCHDAQAASFDSTHFLYARVHLGRQAWADSLALSAKCGTCHETPAPSELPIERWPEAVKYMSQVTYYISAMPAHDSYRDWARTRRAEYLDVLHYYLASSGPAEMLPPDPSISGRTFEPHTLGVPPTPEAPPRIGNVNVSDLDQDGHPDVVACDFNRGAVTWIRQQDGEWQERALARLPFAGHTEVADINGDGHLDVAVAVLGTDVPSDEKNGGVALLLNDGQMNFRVVVPLKAVGRVSDVRPGDFDGDGDTDLVVSVFGWIKEGEIGWLEQQVNGGFTYHRISDKAGGVHVPPVDLNGDGALDFVALISQEHEEVTAFLNDGQGRFTPHVLFKAASPTFGSSGLELTDLDRDGDVDVLFTNGDAVDLASTMVRPYHGVQWLENRGSLSFVYHDLLRLYGAYRAVAGDLDGDGDLDVAVTSLLNDWTDPTRMSLIWLENDGTQRFQAHGISNTPTHLITAALADLDEDGLLDIVTGSMHFEPPFGRLGRITLWRNAGAPHRSAG